MWWISLLRIGFSEKYFDSEIRSGCWWLCPLLLVGLGTVRMKL